MKKEIILFMLTLLGTMYAAGGNDDYKSLSFICERDTPLFEQLTDEMVEQVESLTVSGFLRKEDFKAIDRCHQLKWLDLTETKNDTLHDDSEDLIDAIIIPKGAFRHTAIETFYLPKFAYIFELQALSLFRWDKDCGRPAADEGISDYDGLPHFEKTITVYVTDGFPYLFDPEPIDGYYGCPMQFKLAEGNKWYVEEDGNIFTKDKNNLMKAGNLYNGEQKDVSFDVTTVWFCAFTYSLWSQEQQLITFSDRLREIECLAFAEPALPYVKNDESVHTGGIRFKSWTAPPYVGTPFFDLHNHDSYHHDKVFFPCKAIVPYKPRYILADPRWIQHDIIDEFEYGVLCGTLSPDDKEEFYSQQDKYGPRMEEVLAEIKKVPFRMAGCASTPKYDLDDRTPFVEIVASMKRNVPFTFVNPDTGIKDTLVYSWPDVEDSYSFDIKVYGADGKEWNINIENDEIFSFYNDTDYVWQTIYLPDERPKVGDKCTVTFQFIGARFGASDELSAEFTFEAMPIKAGIKDAKTVNNEKHLYDLTGRPADGTQKGLLIRNGKKVIVK